MGVYLRVDINIVAMVMLLLVYSLAYKRLEKQDSLNSLFSMLSLLVIHQLFFETLTCIINKRPELWLIPITNIIHILLFTITPILTCCWYFLIRRIIVPNQEAFKKRYYVFFLPVLINVVLVVLSPMFHFIFYIDSNNVYHRGFLYLVAAACSYGYIIYGLIMVFFRRKNLPKQDVSLLLVFNGFSVCGGLVQTLIYGPLLLWSCSAFSLVIAFIFMQDRMVHLDSLTGAWDRGSFDYYFSNQLQYNTRKFGFLYIDIDKLKDINDNYGHLEGDYAIRTSINIIRSELSKQDIIVRMGGDEFLIISECNTREDLQTMIDKIESAYESYNFRSTKHYLLECSFGADIFDPTVNKLEQFINHVDALMYQNKQEKRAIM